MNVIDATLYTPTQVTHDMHDFRGDFPILKLKINGKPLVYLDNAASSQMPQIIIDRLVRYQTTQHAERCKIPLR